MASAAAAATASTGATVAAAGSIVSDSVTVLVDGSFADHLIELAPFLARAVQPADSRQAFIESVRKQVGAGGSTGDGEADGASVRESLEADAQKRIAVLDSVLKAVQGLPEPATDRELEGAFNLILALILTSPAPAAPASGSSRTVADAAELTKEQADLLVRLAQLVATAQAAAPTSTANATPAAADRSIAKYRILTNIFNALPARSPVRLSIFLSLLALAATSDDLDLLSSSVGYASSSSAAASSALPATSSSSFDETSSSSSVLLHSLPVWLAQWQLDDTRKAEVLKEVSTILLKQTDAASGARDAEELDAATAARTLAFHKLYLRFLDAASSTSADAQAAAVTTLALALRLPHVFDFASLLESASILALEKSEPALWTLLVDVVLAPGGRGPRFDKWRASNSGVLDKVGVSETVLVRKIRLLDIASLCAAQIYSAEKAAAENAAATTSAGANAEEGAASSTAAAEVPYSLIASNAIPSEPVDDVETWVIDVIRAGLVSGKLSQVNEVFRVYRVSSVVPFPDQQGGGSGTGGGSKEVFSRKQWEVLERKLDAWRESVSRMLVTLNTASKQQQAGLVAALTSTHAQGSGDAQSQQQAPGSSAQHAQTVN